MSYTRNTWKSGDTVTSAKLNNMEDGIASSGAFIVHATVSEDIITLDKTWREIYDAAQEKYVGIILHPIEGVISIVPVLGVETHESSFYVFALNAGVEFIMLSFEAASEDGYPTMAVPVNNNEPGLGPK